MSFQFIDVSGGVVIPGTAYIEYRDEYGQYEVIADVFDSTLSPGHRVNLPIHRTPYFSIAEWYCEWGNIGEAPPFDLITILPSGLNAHDLAI